MTSRGKGNAAEREVAKLVQQWWHKLESGCRFVRTPLSGGWGGPSLRAEFRASGDLMTTAKQWPFGVEVKRREGWSMRNLRQAKASPVWKWWEQTQDAAAEMDAEPMLWFRKNRMPWYVMFRSGYLLLRRPELPDPFEWTVDQLLELNWGEKPRVCMATDLLRLNPRLFA